MDECKFLLLFRMYQFVAAPFISLRRGPFPGPVPRPLAGAPQALWVGRSLILLIVLIILSLLILLNLLTLKNLLGLLSLLKHVDRTGSTSTTTTSVPSLAAARRARPAPAARCAPALYGPAAAARCTHPAGAAPPRRCVARAAGAAEHVLGTSRYCRHASSSRVVSRVLTSFSEWNGSL